MLVPRPVHLMKSEKKVHCTKRYCKTLIFRTSSYSVPGYGKKQKQKQKQKTFCPFHCGKSMFLVSGATCHALSDTMFQTVSRLTVALTEAPIYGNRV